MVQRKPTRRSYSSHSQDSVHTLRRNKDRNPFTYNESQPKRWLLRAMQEIKYFRESTKLIIPKAPFSRLVREIIIDIFPDYRISRIQDSALQALQEAVEIYIVQFFEDAALLILHAKRITFQRQDMILMRRLRGRNDIINR